MKILVVEDNEQKMAEICSCIREMDIIVDVEKKHCIASCITFLAQEQVDILILDAQLPAREGQKDILKDGGRIIIESIINTREIKRPKKLIYLSAYPEALEEEVGSFPQTAILYRQDSIEWKTKLIDNIKFYVESVQQDRRRFKYDVAIITATPIEYEKMHMLSKDWREILFQGDSAYYEETCWRRKGHDYKVIGCKLNQMGMPAAATVTTKLIEQFIPRYVVICGIAGGVEKEAKHGDIIVATKVWDYCSGKYDVSQGDGGDDLESAIRNFKPTSNSVNANSRITNMQDKDYKYLLNKIFREYIPSKMQKPPKIWWGSFACGSSVIKNRAIIDEMILKFDRKTLGIDMESYGVFYAVENAVAPQPKAVCVKAISDFADRDKNNDYQDYAATISAKFSKEFVLDLLEGDKNMENR